MMTRREMLRLLAYTGVGLSSLGSMATFLSSCARRQFACPAIRSDVYGVTILVDGFRADLFRDMLDAGELPNIKKHLVDRGILVDHCVGTFPSTTGPAHLPYVTGIMPGHNNTPGLRWVDRGGRRLRDYCTVEGVLMNNDFPAWNYTLYEVLAGERTTCIFDFCSRGVAEYFRPSVKTLWFIMTGELDQWRRMDENAVEIFKKTYLGGGVPPRYCFVWMPAMDHLAHIFGSTHAKIQDRAKDVDRQIGILMDTLHRSGIYDRTVVSLVADHGLRDTQQNMDIRDTLEKYGFDVLGNLSSNDKFNSLHQHNAARGVSGNGFALLYFAKTKAGRLGTKTYEWDQPIGYEDLRSFPLEGEGRLDLIQLLRNETPIRFVIAKEREDVYRVFSKDAEATIERDYASFRYSAEGSDPLGYSQQPSSAALMDGEFHDKDSWFAATEDTDYPDGLFQITQVFDSPRCGDIVLSSEPGWDFMNEGHRATHGGIEREEMVVPCVVAGPGIRRGTIPRARSVDLHPTYLKFLGIPNYDGEVLNVFL